MKIIENAFQLSIEQIELAKRIVQSHYGVSFNVKDTQTRQEIDSIIRKRIKGTCDDCDRELAARLETALQIDFPQYKGN